MYKTKPIKFKCSCGSERLIAVQRCTEYRTVTDVELNEDGDLTGYEYIIDELIDSDDDPTFMCGHCPKEWDSLDEIKNEGLISVDD